MIELSPRFGRSRCRVRAWGPRVAAVVSVSIAMLAAFTSAFAPATESPVDRVSERIAFTENPRDEDAPSGFTINPDGSARQQSVRAGGRSA
jgi:hypothetical protein